MAHYIPIIMLFVILFVVLRRNRLTIIRKIIRNRKSGDKDKMIELAKRFIDKECIIYSFDGGRQYEGVIKEVVGGAVLIEKDGEMQAINLDFVIRIREYPRNKKGKKNRSFSIDKQKIPDVRMPAIEQYQMEQYLPAEKGRRIVKILRPFFLDKHCFCGHKSI